MDKKLYLSVIVFFISTISIAYAECPEVYISTNGQNNFIKTSACKADKPHEPFIQKSKVRRK